MHEKLQDAGARGEALWLRRDNGYTEHDFVPAMAYVPWQYFTTVYEPDKALEVGTIFPELDKPFVGRGIGRR